MRSSCYASIILFFIFIIIEHKLRIIIFPYKKKKQPFILIWSMDHIYFQLIMVSFVGIFFLLNIQIQTTGTDKLDCSYILLDTISFLASHR